ncbi:MAG TPA: methyltransferase [Gemmatimonadaceae bacterium]|nr:methyltransferase [Gemmatimonadaceae bacterium]
MSDQKASEPSLLVRYGNFLFHYRNKLFPIVLLGLFFTFRPVLLRGDLGLDRWLDLAGILVALAGQILRIAVIGYVYIIRGGKNERIYAEDLVTGGFFSHSRNPLYLGNILVLLGLFMIHNNPWVYAIGVPFFLIGYVAIVAAEEAYLREKFAAAYDAYARDVPRWFPRLKGIAESIGSMTFNWHRVVLKEYGSTFAWTLGAIVLMTAETLIYSSYRENAVFLNTLWICLAMLAIAYSTVRYLKLTRRLRIPPAPPASAAPSA